MDPFNTVNNLRQQRNHMVQTEAQYVFLHDAILEEASSGVTEVTVNKLSQRMSELEKVDEEEESGYKKEFQVSMLWGEWKRSRVRVAIGPQPPSLTKGLPLQAPPPVPNVTSSVPVWPSSLFSEGQYASHHCLRPPWVFLVNTARILCIDMISLSIKGFVFCLC